MSVAVAQMSVDKGASVPKLWVSRLVQTVFSHRKKTKLMAGVYITTDKVIRRYHKDHLQDDSATDVISFWLDKKSPERKLGYVGDIIVSYQTARKVAKSLNIAYRQELARYIVHGVLHLLGYQDTKKAERRIMYRHQEAILKTFFGDKFIPAFHVTS